MNQLDEEALYALAVAEDFIGLAAFRPNVLGVANGLANAEGPTLDNAYQDLLSQRENPLVPGTYPEAALDEDDILCNTNLHTASLFKKLNENFKEKTKFVELYNEQLKDANDAVVKIETSIQTMKNLTGIHYKDGAEIIDTKYAAIQKELFDVKARVVDELNKKLMEKSADLENISRKLNALRKLIITGMSELVKPEDAQKKICPVCFDSEVNMVLVPCGHTYCRGCAEMDRSRNARCHQFRAVINSRIKLYFTA
jgi:hypothetical protein